MGTIKIKISKEFSEAPGPRYVIEGGASGELFRKSVLSPKFREALAGSHKLVIDLDGTAGYGTSFLEESFGGLIREEGFSMEDIIKTIEIISVEEPYLKDDIHEYLTKAANAELVA